MDTKLAKALAKVAAQGRNRYTINAVKLEHDGGDLRRAVATDGRHLAVWQQPGAVEAAPDTTLVPLDAVKRLPAKSMPVALLVGDPPRLATADGTSTPFDPLDGSYPEYAAVIPERSDDRVTVQLDAKRLRDLCDCVIAHAKAAGQDPVLVVSIVADVAKAPLRAVRLDAACEAGGTLTMVLMPITPPV